MKRRQFITLIGGAAAWPLGAGAQQPERVRRLAVLAGLAESNPGMQPRLVALRQELDGLGWIDRRNLRVDYRFAPAGAGAEEMAKELVALVPDVIL